MKCNSQHHHPKRHHTKKSLSLRGLAVTWLPSLLNHQAPYTLRHFTFTSYFQPLSDERGIEGRFLKLGQFLQPLDPYTWIDAKGDTLLSAVLKVWSDDGDERDLKGLVSYCLQMGTEIRMQDREGDILLPIACRRGSRPTVISLLDAGANVHSRDYRGQCILAQPRKHFLEAYRPIRFMPEDSPA